MSVRARIEQAVIGKTSQEIIDLFDNIGLGRLNLGAENEEQRRKAVLDYYFNLPEPRRKDRIAKICNALKIATDDELTLELTSRQTHAAERAAESAFDSNRIATKANTIAVWSLLVSIVAALLAVIALFCGS